MKKPDTLGEQILLGVLLFGATTLVLKGSETAWSAVTKKLPPPQRDDQSVDLKDELAWVVLSGLAVGLIRVFVRRSLPRIL